MTSITLISAVAMVAWAGAVVAMVPHYRCAGCYTPMDVAHPKVAELVAYYMDTKGPHMMLDQVVRASKQVVAGMNYKMTLHFHQLILCGTPMPYQCTVTIYEDLSNVRSVSNEQCHMMQVPHKLSEC